MTVPTGPSSPGTILVVDDQEIVCDVLQHVLEACGFTVLAARSGRMGLALYRQHASQIRAVLLDLWLPGESAAEIFDEMRHLQPDLPVILISGTPEAIARQAFARAGLTAFLQKPFDMPAFLTTLRQALEVGPRARDPEASLGR